MIPRCPVYDTLNRTSRLKDHHAQMRHRTVRITSFIADPSNTGPDQLHAHTTLEQAALIAIVLSADST